MAEQITRVVILDEGLYVGTGLVNRWFSRVGNTMYHNIVAAAPLGDTGELKAGIVGGHVQHEASLRILGFTIESTAPHTRYVIEGTALDGEGYIYSSKGQRSPEIVAAIESGERVSREENQGMWMVIRDGGPKFHLKVHGQRHNNFMKTGYDRTARTHPSLHPIFPGLVV